MKIYNEKLERINWLKRQIDMLINLYKFYKKKHFTEKANEAMELANEIEKERIQLLQELKIQKP